MFQRKIFQINETLNKANKICLAITWLWFFTFFFFNLLRCSSIRASWDANTLYSKQCVPFDVFVLWYELTNVLNELLIAGVAVYAVTKQQHMTAGAKTITGATFACGAL